ncbi:MAG: hypothetical protein ABGX04_13990, partial [Myxococcales bacterium]
MRQIPMLSTRQGKAYGQLSLPPSALFGGLMVCLAFGLFTGPWGCARNPVSGRPEAVLTSESAEIEQGNRLAQVIESEMGLV